MTEYVYRVVHDDGTFAKPDKPRGSYPGQYSKAKGLYTTKARALSAIRAGVGSRVQRATVVWEDIDNG